MPKILACLVYEHDLRLVLMAAIILAAGSSAFIALSKQLRKANGHPHWVMVLFAAAVMSATAWATHFVAMVGYKLSDEPKHYIMSLTLGSALLILPTATAGLTLALHNSTRLRRLLGGAIMGGGVAAMHYCGMSALQVPFGIEWDIPTVVVSVLIGMAFSAASIEVAFGKKRRGRNEIYAKAIAIVLMVLSVAGLHFTGMSAMTVYTIAQGQLISGVDEVMLAMAIAGLSIVITAMAFSISFGDNPRTLWRRYAIALALFLSTGIIIFGVGSGVEADRAAYLNTTQLVVRLEGRLVELSAEAERQNESLSNGEQLKTDQSAQILLSNFRGDYGLLLNSLEHLPHRSKLKDHFIAYNASSTQESLADATQDFLWIASKKSAFEKENSRLIALYAIKLLERYDAFANEVTHAQETVNSRSKISWFFMGASSLLVFAFQGLAIFWPAHRSITRTLDELEQRKQTAERLAIVAEHTSDAVFIADAQGQIEWSNKAALAMLKTSSEDIQKKRLKDLLSRNHASRKAAILKTAEQFQRKDPVYVQSILVDDEDNSIWASLSLTPIFDENDTLSRIIAVARDISEQKALEEKVLQHNDDLAREVRERTQTIMNQSLKLEHALASERELNQMQSEFISITSHEFRTPLTIIDGLARRLDKRADRLTPEEIKERASNIRSTVVRMTMLIDRTLDASRLSSGQIKLKPSFFPARKLIEEVSQRQSEVSPNHNIHLDIDEYPAELFGDGRLLDNVFTNLLSNAVKYSPDKPDVYVKGWIEGPNAMLKVRDSGVGIPKEELPKIFQRFFRAKTADGISGTGIGLNLVKSLVDMHWGKATIDSKEGEWTEITIALPLESPLETEADTAMREANSNGTWVV